LPKSVTIDAIFFCPEREAVSAWFNTHSIRRFGNFTRSARSKGSEHFFITGFKEKKEFFEKVV